MLSVEVPPLARVTVCPVAAVVSTCDPNCSCATFSAGAAPPTPVPVIVNVWGEVCAESTTEMEAVRVPESKGLKVTVILQLADVASTDWQVVVKVKSVALLPPSDRLEMFKAAVPELLSVTVCVPLDVPTVWLAKVRLVAFKLAAGVPLMPVPARFTACVAEE